MRNFLAGGKCGTHFTHKHTHVMHNITRLRLAYPLRCTGGHLTWAVAFKETPVIKRGHQV